MGAVLVQDRKLIEYASPALTSAEQNWTQIEKETLTVTFGLERFDQYTYGRRIVIENDNKPLAAILKKPLSQGPKRLQALILRLHRYHVDFHYMEGSKLSIADTLSRAYLDVPDTHVRVMKVNVLRWLDTVFQGQYLPSLSINYVAINKVLEKLPPQLY